MSFTRLVFKGIQRPTSSVDHKIRSEARIESSQFSSVKAADTLGKSLFLLQFVPKNVVRSLLSCDLEGMPFLFLLVFVL